MKQVVLDFIPFSLSTGDFFFLNIYFKNIFSVYLFSGTFQFGILDTSAIQTIGLATTIKSSYLKCKIQNSAMR